MAPKKKAAKKAAPKKKAAKANPVRSRNKIKVENEGLQAWERGESIQLNADESE